MKDIRLSEKLVRQFIVECSCSCCILRFSRFLESSNDTIYIEHMSSFQPNYDKKSKNQMFAISLDETKKLINELENLQSIHNFTILDNNHSDCVIETIIDFNQYQIIYYSSVKKFKKGKHDFDIMIENDNFKTFVESLKEIIA